MRAEETEAFINKSFSIDFARVRLTNGKQSFSGKGSLFQDKSGIIKIKIFANKKQKSMGLVLKEKIYKSEVGSLIKGDEYFRLTAIDLSNRKWTSERILPDMKTGVDGSVVITAELFEVLCYTSMPTKSFSKFLAIIKYPYSGKFPFNTSTYTEEKIGNEKYSSFDLNVANFSCNGFNVLIKKINSVLDVKIKSTEKSLPPFIETRVTETLQFMLAQKMNWVYFQEYQKELEVIHLRSFNEKEIESNLYAPLGVTDFDSNKDFQKLFESYLNFVIMFKRNKFHVISSFIVSLIQAGQGSVEALGLTLGVSVEGLIISEFKKLKIPKRISKKEIKAFEEWICQGYLTENNLQRFQSLKGSLLEIRVIDKLHELKNLGIIDKYLVDSWKDLRNPSAHPDRSKEFELKEYLKLIDSTLTLFYQLVFLKIGYTGAFRDYSSTGWKLAKFEKHL